VDTGRMKIEWVSRYMKLLNLLREKFSREKPLAGLRIGISIHLEAKTAYLALTLSNLGAHVAVTGSNPLSTQDDVAETLKNLGIEVHAKRTHDEKEYLKGLHKVLDYHPDLILDDGADLTVLAHTERKDALENLKGVSEETTTGVRRLRALEKRGMLVVPVIAVNDSKMKFLFDNRYGTGQSTWDSIMRNTNVLIAGKNVVVSGYGWCGRGIALRAKGLGANVIVTEVDPVRAVEAVMDGFQVMRMDDASKIGDIFVTATGNRDVIRREHFLNMKDGAILANAGHFNVEVSMRELEEISVKKFHAKPNIDGYVLQNGKTIFVIAEGRLVNLAAGDGHPIEIMDISFSLQVLSLLYLSKNHGNLEKKVHLLPPEIDEEVARLKLKALDVEIDSLTESQRRYMEGWQ